MYHLEHYENVTVNYKVLYLILRCIENGAELLKKRIISLKEDEGDLRQVIDSEDKLAKLTEICDNLRDDWSKEGLRLSAFIFNDIKCEARSLMIDWKPLLDKGLVEPIWTLEDNPQTERVKKRIPIKHDEKAEPFIQLVRVDRKKS